MQWKPCYLCKKLKDTRPYGEGSQEICFPCMKESPDREAEAERQLGAILDGCLVPMVTDDGVRDAALAKARSRWVDANGEGERG